MLTHSNTAAHRTLQDAPKGPKPSRIAYAMPSRRKKPARLPLSATSVGSTIEHCARCHSTWLTQRCLVQNAAMQPLAAHPCSHRSCGPHAHASISQPTTYAITWCRRRTPQQTCSLQCQIVHIDTSGVPPYISFLPFMQRIKALQRMSTEMR